MNPLSLKIMFTLFVLTKLFFTSIECSRSLASQKEEDLVTKVCKKTRYYDLCMTILFQDSRKWTSDTKGLAKIVIEKDLNVAKQILDDLQSFGRDTGKSRLVREKCGKCSGEYKAIVLTLIPSANKALDSGRLGAAIQALKSIANYAKACDDVFSKGDVKEPFSNMSVHDISLLASNVIEIIT